MKIYRHYSNNKLQKRLLAIILLVTFVFVALFFRLAYLQVFSAEFLNVKAKQQWLRDLPLRATRGDIYDRNGVVLASDYSTYDIYVRSNSVENYNEVATTLSLYLDIDFDKVFSKVSNRKVSEVLIKTQVESNVALPILNQNLPGIFASINSKRHYNFGDFLTQILGFTSVDGVGQAGVEAYYNSYLTGIDGQVLSESDVRGRGLASGLTYYQDAIKGLNLTLTIDSQIQNIIENALESAMFEHKSKSASCIVMDPNTSQIIAISTKNSFDLNDVPRDDIDLLNKLSANYCVSNVMEPGSTFKLFTISAALELGLTNEEEHFHCPGFRVVDGQRIKCWKTKGHGTQTLIEGICNSCNCVFMDLAQRIGVNNLYQYLRAFGFGAQTGIDLFAESGGILMNQANVKTVDLARIGFGHAVAITPIQLANAVCSIVNGGNLLTPYIVSDISNENQVVKSFSCTNKGSSINEETAKRVREMMLAVVNHSNGANASVAGYEIGGKTGTAQKYENGIIAQGKYVSSFVGFAPYDNPKYVVLFLVDEPGNGVYYGSLVAAPFAKQIFANIFDVKNIEKSSDEQEVLSEIMPDVVGKSVSAALSLIEKAGLQCEIDGDNDIVIAQLPMAGTYLRKNSVVLIKT